MIKGLRNSSKIDGIVLVQGTFDTFNGDIQGSFALLLEDETTCGRVDLNLLEDDVKKAFEAAFQAAERWAARVYFADAPSSAPKDVTAADHKGAIKFDEAT